MKLVDIHCHLNHKDFKNDLDVVLERARKAEVKVVVISGTNTVSNREVLELAKKDSLIKVSLGIHPIDALGLFEGDTGIPKQEGEMDLEEEFRFIEENKEKIVAVGEVGLDFHWDKKHHEKQKEIFRKIIRFAIEIKKPLIVHTWEAEEECLDILEEEVGREIEVVLHCFGGRKSLITRAKELGYYFSVPPSMVKSSNFQALVKKVDIGQLLTETDAPWQGPFSDRKNEPAFVIEAVKKIAEIKSLSEEVVAERIWENYKKVFGKK